MASKFKKGDAVYVFRAWDDSGTVYAQKLIVDSCGAKQMHATTDDGQFVEHRFYMQYEYATFGINGGSPVAIVKRSECADPEAFGLELAAKCIAVYVAHCDRCIANNANSAGYIKSMEAKKASIHEPRFIWR